MRARGSIGGVLVWALGCGGAGGGDTGSSGPAPGSSSGATAGESTAGESTAVDPTGGARVLLADPTLWTPVEAADDPLAAHRPATVDCPAGTGWLVEAQGIEVNTQACTYAMFSQPALAAVEPGAHILGSLYYFDLTAEAPATAHVALQIGDALFWEREIAIPGPADAFVIDVPAELSAAAGTPVYFHLHNHGQNTWTLGKLEVEGPGA